MIELKKEFKKRGTTFKQLFKDERIAIYELSRPSKGLEGNEDVLQRVGVDDGKVNVWYEVFRYKVKPPNNFIDDEYEAYPSNEDFGQWAWSCSNLKCVKKVLKKHFSNHASKIPSIWWEDEARIDSNAEGGQLIRQEDLEGL